MTQDYSVEVSLCWWTNNTNTKLDILEWYSIWWIKSTTLYFPYGNPVHFDQKWTHSPAQPQWVGLVGIKIAPFSAGMQTCGEIWPGSRDSSSPAFLYVSHSDTNLRPESAGPVFPPYVHNKLEQRCYSEMMACGLSHAQCPPSLSSPEKPTSSLPVSAPMEKWPASTVRAQGKFWPDTSVTVHEVTSSDISITMTSTSCTRAQIWISPTLGWGSS